MSSRHFGEVMDFYKRHGFSVGDDPYQLEYVKAMLRPLEGVASDRPLGGSNNAIFINAKAGTGKTSLAALLGCYAIEKELVDQIIYVRAEVDVGGEQRGALPGNDAEKHSVYTQPFVDALDSFKPGIYHVWSQALFNKQPRVIATHPGHFRGITKSRAFVIIDESQNLSYAQLTALYTRFKQDCIVVTLGHTGQVDLPEKKRESIAGMLPFVVFALHHAKRGAFIGKLVTNYRGEFAQWSDEIGVTISELRKTGGSSYADVF